MRNIIQKNLIQFCKTKIINLEASIAKTRKGFNKIMRLFKSSDRNNEHEGLHLNFKMNKPELELRNLTDLAFVFQDYETTYTNAVLPSNEFKSSKAFLHAAHCDEIKLLSRIAFDK